MLTDSERLTKVDPDHTENYELNPYSLINLSLLDPPRFGWPAVGNVIDLCPPHERARRRRSRSDFLETKKSEHLKMKENEKTDDDCSTIQQKEKDVSPQNENRSSGKNHMHSNTSNIEHELNMINTSTCEHAKANIDPVILKLDTDMKHDDVQDDAQNGYQTKRNDAHSVNQLCNSKNDDSSAFPGKETCLGAPRMHSSDYISPSLSEECISNQSDSSDIKISTPTSFSRGVCTDKSRTRCKDKELVVEDNVPHSSLQAITEFSEKHETESLTQLSKDEKKAVPSNQLMLMTKKEHSGICRDNNVHTPTDTTNVADKNQNESESTHRQGEEEIFEFHALVEENKLDIFTYHRGVVGMEPRDEFTGHLLCPIKPSDTNHDWDEPNLKFKVIVTFPLEEPDFSLLDAKEQYCDKEFFQGDDFHDNQKTLKRANKRRRDIDPQNNDILENKKRREKMLAELPWFQETIDWDLGNPLTPTPMNFAADVAADFGLSFCQTLDLAATIQTQIDDFVRKTIHYQMPITLYDSTGTSRFETSLGPPGLVVPKLLKGGLRATSITSTMKASMPRKEFSKPSGKRLGTSSASKKRGTSVVRGFGLKGYDVVPKHLLPSHGGNLPIGRQKDTASYSVEQEYIDEMLSRAKAECIESLNGKEYAIVENDVCHICHARKPSLVTFACGVKTHTYCDFHCSTRLGFKISQLKEEDYNLNYCPICCLQCVCAKCTRRVNSVATTLKQQCLKQNVSIQDVVLDVLPLTAGSINPISQKNTSFRSKPNVKPVKKKILRPLRKSSENLLSPTSSTPDISKRRQKSLKSKEHKDKEEVGHSDKTRKSQKNLDIELKSTTERQKRNVKNKKYGITQKVPQSEFPVEIDDKIDLDPADRFDYLTIFTPKGRSIKAITEWNDHQCVEMNVEKMLFGDEFSSLKYPGEDGNVDYCVICDKGGNLLCCDKCPRSYHKQCLQGNAHVDEDGDTWICQRCKYDDKNGEELKGETFLSQFRDSLTNLSGNKHHEEKASILSQIREMIEYLLEFDFGYLFENPVDLKSVANYDLVIDRPMDYTTILTQLENGEYFSNAAAEGKKPSNKEIHIADLVILEVLKDLELVWHNCLLFHPEGSSIFRMAQVQQRKAHSLRSKNFDHLLISHVKDSLMDYTHHCRLKRQFISLELKKRQPLGINQISAKATGGAALKNSRGVAVFDNESCMLVKAYSKVISAANAALFLQEEGYESGYESVNSNFVRGLIRQGAEKPTQTLFGYRWFYYDDLLNGSFTVNDSLECRTETFAAKVDEEAPLEDKKNDDTIQHVSHAPTLDNIKELNSIEKKKPNLDFAPEPFVPSGKFFKDDRLETSMDGSIVVIKKCAVSENTLAGFESVENAYQDWLEMWRNRLCPDNGCTDEEPNIDHFVSKFLRGKQELDSVYWRNNSNYADSQPYNPKVNTSIGKDDAKFPISLLCKSDENLLSVTPHDASAITKKIDAFSSTIAKSNDCLERTNAIVATETRCQMFQEELIESSQDASYVNDNAGLSLSSKRRRPVGLCDTPSKKNKCFDCVELGPHLEPMLAAAKSISFQGIRKGPKKVLAIQLVDLTVVKRYKSIKEAEDETEDKNIGTYIKQRSFVNGLIYIYASEESNVMRAMQDVAKVAPSP